jgi:hypothetical protein
MLPQGLTGTLERYGIALELSQIFPGPAQKYRISLVFLLINWQMSRGTPGIILGFSRKSQYLEGSSRDVKPYATLQKEMVQIHTVLS